MCTTRSYSGRFAMLHSSSCLQRRLLEGMGHQGAVLTRRQNTHIAPRQTMGLLQILVDHCSIALAASAIGQSRQTDRALQSSTNLLDGMVATVTMVGASRRAE